MDTANTITWTSGDGKRISVEALGYETYRVTVDGSRLPDCHMIDLPRGGQFDAARRMGVVGTLGFGKVVVGVKAEQRAALIALDARLTAEQRAATADRDALLRLETALQSAEERLTRDGYGATGAAGRAVDEAQAALEAAVAKHPAEWAEIVARRAAKRAERQTEIDASTIKRGVD